MWCSIESVLFGSFAGLEEGIITEEMESTEGPQIKAAEDSLVNIFALRCFEFMPIE